MGMWSDHYMVNPKLVQANYRAVRGCKEYMLESGLGCSVETVLDIGANMGIYTLAFAEAFPGSVIHAFEPVGSNFEYLSKHVSKATKYGCDINLHNFGFWKEEADLQMGIPQERNDVQNTGLYRVGADKLACMASFKVLDDWSKVNKVQPDFIKIDAEEADEIIVAHGKEAVAKAKWLLIESSEDSLRGLLEEIGFVSCSKFRQDTLWFNEKGSHV
tara:strand:- start:19134 stop:19781 length:648 start_codon:yes stop_codon:yes gene_type:complete